MERSGKILEIDDRFAPMYSIIRRILFLFPPESVHYFSMNCLRLLCAVPLFKKWVSRLYAPVNTEPTAAFGLRFKNKVGLAAGFDKNAKYLNELEALGFGFIEIGTVTPLPQEGNEKPRLFRLPKDKALINRMGFNNEGVEIVAKRLATWKAKQLQQKNNQSPNHIPLIIGGNIGKNKVTPNEDAWKDYEIGFNALFEVVDYFVVNVSSPNTPGLRELQEKASLQKILGHLQTLNQKHPNPKPILLKIAPDLSKEQIDDVIDLALSIRLDGLVATNTTLSREGLRTSAAAVSAIGAGGLSGKPVQQTSTSIVQYINDKSNGKIPVIASGGIFTAADAAEKTAAGSLLVQVWTGFIYEGPAIVKNICRGL